MASEKSDESKDAKWAGELYSFIQLFRRESSHFLGLIILEIGWAVLMSLLLPLLPEGSFARTKLPFVLVAGALTIAAIWLLFSGLIYYAWLILKRPVRAVLILILQALWFLVDIVADVSASIEIRSLKSRRGADYRGKLKQVAKQTASNRGRKAKSVRGNRELARLLRRREIRNALGLRSIKIADGFKDKFSKRLAWLVSTGRIGLAPLYSYTYQEDEKAVKASMQLFTLASSRLSLTLRQHPAARRVGFSVLPPQVPVRNNVQAQVMRWLFDFDALLWGSYVSSEPPRIWLNIERRLAPISADSTDSERRAEIEAFRAGQVGDDLAMVTIDQRDPLDAYIVLLVTLIEALRSRELKRFRLYPKVFDSLALSARSERQAISRHLVRDVLLRLPPMERTVPALVTVAQIDARPEPPVETEMTPSAKSVLVAYVSQWLDEQLGSAINEWKGDLEPLRDVARKCQKLLPDDAGPHYRLAVLNCLLDEKEDDARSELEKGLEKDLPLTWAAEQPLLFGYAVMKMNNLLDNSSRWDKVEIAKAAIYTARAIKARKVHEDLIKAYKESNLYKWQTLDRRGGRKYSTSERLLYGVLGLEIPSGPPSTP